MHSREISQRGFHHVSLTICPYFLEDGSLLVLDSDWGHGSAPHQSPLPKQCLAKRSGCSCSKPTLERMNLATTESHPRKSGSRSSTGSLLHPSSTPRSPQTPSLPDARPSSARFRCGGRESKFLAVITPTPSPSQPPRPNGNTAPSTASAMRRWACGAIRWRSRWAGRNRPDQPI